MVSPDARNLQNIRIVLVEPLKSGNLGSVARAMENCGLSDLVLVNPQAALDDQARAMAANAQKTLRAAKAVSTLDDALVECEWAVGFTGCVEKRQKEKVEYADLLPEIFAITQKKKLAFVFGREDWGLDSYALDRCRYIAGISVAPSYPSLNLAHAVLLASFLFYDHCCKQGAPALTIGESTRAIQKREASFEAREGLYHDLEETLLRIGFINRNQVARSAMRKVRRILERTHLTEREVRIVRGVCRQLRWFTGARRRENPSLEKALQE